MSCHGQQHDVSRRDFLCAVAGCAAAAAGACSEPTHIPFFRRHLAELSPEQIQAILADLEREYSERFGKDVTVTAEGPRRGVEFGLSLIHISEPTRLNSTSRMPSSA